ncbi:MAG TPA: rRNA methyltransferase [Leptospiraceae bacterium]|nr:rRNA methyltransferase [Spirochaetaceae bacterium]HBS05175.1 rRNA methyltransferase [Leptospiraceae bacterium]
MAEVIDQGLLEYLESFLTESRRTRIQEILKWRTRWITLVLEDLVDPHNASACLRSAEACGLQDVHIIENRHPFQVKTGVSMGSAHWLSINRHTALDSANQNGNRSAEFEATTHCYDELKARGYTILATSPHESSISLPDVDLNQPLAIVFGSEKDGISPVARQKADYALRIPMYGFTESFNISVSAAITLYDLTGRLRRSSRKWQLSDEEKQELSLQWARHSLKRSDLLEQYYRNKGMDS